MTEFVEIISYGSETWPGMFPESPKCAEIRAKDEEIFRANMASIDHIERPRLGDFILYPDGTYRRFAHKWEDGAQPTSADFGGSFYLGEGWVQHSGGLDPIIPWDRFELTDEKRRGSCWMFSENRSGRARGVHATTEWRVYRLRPIFDPLKAIEAGDILVSSWGYEQTNVDFYRVVDRRGKATLILQRVGVMEVKALGSMSGECVPNPEVTIGEPFTKRARRIDPKSYESVKLESYAFAYLWDGKPKYRSSYA